MFIFSSEETYQDGQVILEAGASGNWVYMILSGSVEIYRMGEGKKFVIETLKEGEVFGELSFLGNIKRTASARAIGETIVGIIDRDSLDEEYNKLSSDFRSILISVATRFKTMIDRMSDVSVRREARLPRSISLSYKDQESFAKAYTANISGGGLFIRTKKPLGQGDQFLLNLQLAGLPNPLKIKCEVVWSRSQESDAGKRPPGMGVKFLEMAQKDEQTLNHYLQVARRGIRQD
jgi:CRP/FNR family cyclic AMP-dependent transcriptional regulator